jgi:hypothetical protein
MCLDPCCEFFLIIAARRATLAPEADQTALRVRWFCAQPRGNVQRRFQRTLR